MNPTNQKKTRLDFRLPLQVKVSIEAAARILGLTTSAFVLAPAIERAQKVLQDSETIRLTQKQHEHFMKALDNPPKPNKKLQKLFKKHAYK